MKKPREMRRLTLSRETLAKLDPLDGAQLDMIAGGQSNPCSGTSSCTILRCTCPPA
jgi:hypothetical protein